MPAKKERVLEEWEEGRVVIVSSTYNTVEVTVNVKVLLKVRALKDRQLAINFRFRIYQFNKQYRHRTNVSVCASMLAR